MRTDPYPVWLSEIMLQQTTVVAVAPYFNAFLARWPDLASLAAADLDAVLHAWQGLGYYARARNLHACARVVVERHGGGFPDDEAVLRALPGIGAYTAAAIAAIAFGRKATAMDGNVERVIARLYAVETPLPDAKPELYRLAARLTPDDRAGDYAQALMDLGATICTRRAPRCGDCPVAGDCVARIEERIATLPSPRPRKALPQRAVRALVIERAGTILFEKRPAAGIWGGLWSLPEAEADADVVAHCRAHFAAKVAVGGELAPIEHAFTHYRLTILPQRVAVHSWPPRAESPGLLWLTRDDALAAALPAPIRKLLRSL
jgi:A/G-specific adenine glycosylase